MLVVPNCEPCAREEEETATVAVRSSGSSGYACPSVAADCGHTLYPLHTFVRDSTIMYRKTLHPKCLRAPQPKIVWQRHDRLIQRLASLH